MLDIVDKDFKAAIINMLKERKESLLKEVKENVMAFSNRKYHQYRNKLFKKWKF